MAQARRILLAQEQAILRDGLRAILSPVNDLEVVADAAHPREAVRLAAGLKPDLVIIDLSMPHASGIEALSELRRVSPATKVLVVAVHKTEEYASAAFEAGADGYFTKDLSASELVVACRAVLAGMGYACVPCPAAAAASAPLDGGSGGESASRCSTHSKLSTRERDVLKLVAEGRRTREIATYLFISPRTVDRHRAMLMKKLNLHSVPALTTYAIEHGLVGR